ncbi:MAG TPA: isopentenyl phosphate kinase family protein [Methanotrichaceae archaeon]|nr:isopentenyl phosphate kinase family protein [Methanotrichaceae archaeon]
MTEIKILKIGGSVLTDKTRLESARMEEIERIATEIARHGSGLILVHGAGSFGHIHAKKYNLAERFSPEGVLETHRSVVRLNDLVVESLRRAGSRPVPVHPLSCTLLRDGRIDAMETEPVIEMVNNGLVPVLHGDVAMDRSIGAGIVSGDQLVSHLARTLKPEIVALGTAVDGVIFRGEVLAEVRREALPKIGSELGASAGVDVTGGMRGKLEELLDLADQGVESQIFNAEKAGQIERILMGERVGTLVEGRI